MKKMLCLLVVAALCLSLCACSNISSLADRFLPDFEGFGNGQFLQGDTPLAQPSANGEAVILPHFENQPLSQAADWLTATGIAFQVNYVTNQDFAEGYVISQSIPAGQAVSSDSVLLLTVAQGMEECPYPYSQKLTVSAAAGSSYATAVLYEWRDGNWQQLAAYNACVGQNGIGAISEGSRKTPQGIHPLGIVLSANTVYTSLPVRTVSSSTCVVDDASSVHYNMIMETYQVPEGTSYDQIGRGLTNGTTYATIYIEHNGSGLSRENVVPGKGSAIGLRGQYGALQPTYGDVDISSSDMMDLLSLLDAEKSPVIEIIVG